MEYYSSHLSLVSDAPFWRMNETINTLRWPIINKYSFSAREITSCVRAEFLFLFHSPLFDSSILRFFAVDEKRMSRFKLAMSYHWVSHSLHLIVYNTYKPSYARLTRHTHCVPTRELGRANKKVWFDRNCNVYNRDRTTERVVTSNENKYLKTYNT